MALRWFPVLAAVLLAGCAGDGAPTSLQARQVAVHTGQCFRGEEVNSFNIEDARVAYVGTRRGYVYRLDTPTDCFDESAVSLSMPHHRMSNSGICLGEVAAVSTVKWRGSRAKQCASLVSGPIRDSRVSGLWSRTD